MIMSREEAFLKARAQLQTLCELIVKAGEEEWRVDDVERAARRRAIPVDEIHAADDEALERTFPLTSRWRRVRIRKF